MEYILQKITFPKEVDERYIRGDYEHCQDGSVRLAGQGFFSTDTYFNAFSVGKWCAYTTVENLKLRIRARGSFALSVFHDEEKISEFRISDGTDLFETELPLFDRGILYFSIRSPEENAVLYEASYLTDAADIRDIRLALNICTYRRFEALSRNVELLKTELLEAEDSNGLRDRLQIFITDNASEIDPDRFGDERIHLAHSPNLGGAGGFTKGLLRILQYNETHSDPLTHVLFLDDDAGLNPESIRRTWALLGLLKPEFERCFIAGAMLRSEDPCIQHENGALWNRGKCVYVGRGLDMSDPGNVIRNEQPAERDYGAWWFCCVPMSVVSRQDLPFPFCIHGDDIEFSLRHAEGIITMNGIAVEHPASLHVRTSANEYYNLRNMLMINARYVPGYGIGKILMQSATAMTVALLRHRYRDMGLIRRAVLDYLKGPGFLLETDASALNDEIRQAGYRFEDMSALTEDGKALLCMEEDARAPGDGGFRALWRARSGIGARMALLGRVITLNGWLLPRKHRTEVHYMNVHPVRLFRAGTLILINEDRKGMVLKKRFWQLFVMAGYLAELWVRLLIRNRAAVREYRDRWQELTSEEYWEKAYERTA